MQKIASNIQAGLDYYDDTLRSTVIDIVEKPLANVDALQVYHPLDIYDLDINEFIPATEAHVDAIQWFVTSGYNYSGGVSSISIENTRVNLLPQSTRQGLFHGDGILQSAKIVNTYVVGGNQQHKITLSGLIGSGTFIDSSPVTLLPLRLCGGGYGDIPPIFVIDFKKGLQDHNPLNVVNTEVHDLRFDFVNNAALHLCNFDLHGFRRYLYSQLSDRYLDSLYYLDRDFDRSRILYGSDLPLPAKLEHTYHAAMENSNLV